MSAVSEADYARLVSDGCLTVAARGLIEARDLLLSTGHPAADRLVTATRLTSEAQQMLRPSS